MAINKRLLNKLGLSLWMTTCIVIPNVSSATSITLASVPLFTQSNADPNIMFILDNSTSMGDSFDGTTRIDAAKSALTTVVNSLSGVRVGFGILAPPSGAVGTGGFDEGGLSIQTAIGDISSVRSSCLSAISSTSANCSTTIMSGGVSTTVDASPLSCALRDAAHYFSNNASGSMCGGMGGGGGGGGSSGGSVSLTLADGSSTTGSDFLGTRISNAGPVQYSCQSNFTVLITDGLDNMAFPTTGTHGINTVLQDYDGDCSASAQTAGGYTCDANGFDKKSTDTYDTSSDISGVAESSDYLDDVAKAMYDNDLLPNLNDSSGNAVTNNMRTFVVGFNDPALAASNTRLQNVASQGGGTFSYASTAADLATSIEAATSSIVNLIGSAAAVTFNTATLGTNSAVYLALFNSSTWSGDLVAYDLNDTSGAIGSQSWSAATKLDALSDTNAVTNRVILTYNGTQGIPFRWPTNFVSPSSTELSAAQINDLLTNVPAGSTNPQKDTFGQNVVNFLRGDTSNEGSLFRSRSSRLGDIVHAGPVFVGAPALTWPDGTTGGGANGFPAGTNAYSIFKYNSSTATNPGAADRAGVVYVGSNDGMLHGFATDNSTIGTHAAGDEVLAYAPKALFSTASQRGYHYLAESSYNHQYYVDLQPDIADYFDDSSSSWKTILVGGLRGGGRALYALDITNPNNFSEANAASIVLGEFTNSDDVDLGYTFSRPTIVLTNATQTGHNRWAIIFGNGYNADTGAGADGKAYLYVLFLDADLTDGWTLGSDYLKIPTGVGSTTTINGLSTPTAVDVDGSGDGRIDRVYAGDLQGNMWAFDLSSSNTTNWKSAYYSTGGSAAPQPLFSAGSTQPITTQPEVVFNPDVSTTASNKPNTLVLFGTGRYLASGDNANLGAQAFYGVWDDNTGNLTSSDLVAQTITESSGQRTVSTNAVNYSNSVKGWYLNLNVNSDGERSVTNAVVRGDYVWFNTSIPTSTICSYGGDGWQMVVNYTNGNNPDSAIFDTNGDGVVNGSDTTLSGEAFTEGLPASPSFLSNRRYTPGTMTQSGGDVVNDAVEILQGSGTGRLSWEELMQQ